MREGPIAKDDDDTASEKSLGDPALADKDINPLTLTLHSGDDERTTALGQRTDGIQQPQPPQPPQQAPDGSVFVQAQTSPALTHLAMPDNRMLQPDNGMSDGGVAVAPRAPDVECPRPCCILTEPSPAPQRSIPMAQLLSPIPGAKAIAPPSVTVMGTAKPMEPQAMHTEQAAALASEISALHQVSALHSTVAQGSMVVTGHRLGESGVSQRRARSASAPGTSR